MEHGPRRSRREPPTPSASAAAPGSAQDAWTRPVTNHTAPVDAGSCAAVEGAGDVAAARGAATAGDAERARDRTVLHVDIDAFFAAIEQQRDPRLQGRPVIVGAGVIASCSYEARRFGLRAGMSLSEARRLCPTAVILEGHAQVYRCYAERVFERCRQLSPDVETYLYD